MQVGLIGHPLGHSISPAMQNAAFEAAGLDWRFAALDTPPEDLPGVIERLRDAAWAGANVTVPHKARVLSLLDVIDPSARAVGAVNTIVNGSGQLHGYNTDGAGLLEDLRQLGVSVGNRPVVILGAGGAARAAAFSLRESASRLDLICRTPDRGFELAWELQSGAALEVGVLSWDNYAFTSVPAGSLVLQCTPVGMWPEVESSPWPKSVDLPSGSFIYDLVYNPPITRLVARARAAGLGAATGLGMLVEQGALAFELWTGQPAPRRQMRAAAEGVLR